MLIILKSMKRTTIIFFTLIVFGIIGLMVWGGNQVSTPQKIVAGDSTTSHPARTGKILTTPETFYDFGTISMKNGNVNKIFKVSNNSTEDIKVPSITTSCMCTTAFILNENGERSRPFGMPGHGGAVPKANAIVEAGRTLDIEVVYDPNAHGPVGVGLIERSVFLEDENGNVMEFKFKVNVTP